MATQGMLVVIEKEKDKRKVLYKVVCGCDGSEENLEQLAAEFKDLVTKGSWKLKKISLKDLYCVAGRYIGCSDCLIVIGEDESHFGGEEEIPELYRRTFDNPSFNPRWESGKVGQLIKLVFDIR